MNTYSRRRRTFLSLLLSVAMVLSYSAAFIGTSAEDVYAETSLITVDTWNADAEGVFHLELEEGYAQDYSQLVIGYTALVDMDSADNFVKFELEDPSGFALNTNTGFSMATGDYQSVSLVPDEGLEVGQYNLTLNVYEDASGTGSFEDAPVAAYNIVVDVVPYKPFVINTNSDAVSFEMLEGIEPDENDGSLWLVITNYDEKYDGQSISPHIRFEITGENADSFYIDGLEDITFPSSEDASKYEPVYVRPVPGLTAGNYSAELTMYVDNTGTQDLNTFYKSIPVYLTVYEREEYAARLEVDNDGSFTSLLFNYTSEDLANNTATVTIRNLGKNAVTVDPSQLMVMSSRDIKSEDFNIELLVDEPYVLEAGKSVELAKVAPVAGLEPGQYGAYLECPVSHGEDTTYYSYEIGFRVLKDEPSLVCRNAPVDFGAILPGFEQNDEVVRSVEMVNDGNVPLRITNVTKPENGPFADAEEEDYGFMLRSEESAEFSIFLDAESPDAGKLGTYKGTYVLTAQECDDEGNLVEGGSTVTVEIPVKAEITDTLPASFETNCNSGPDPEPLWINTATGYTSSEAKAVFSLVGGYGEHFYGKRVGDFVQFGLDETGAELISIEGFNPAETLPELGQDEPYYKTIELSLDEGLDVGDYQANVYMYVDPKGTGTFDKDNPTEVIPVNIQVYEGDTFEILPEEGEEFEFVMEQGYSDEDAAASAQGVIVRNRSKSDLVIESPEKLMFWTEDETKAFDISYYEEDFPIVIAPGERKKIAVITPRTVSNTGKYVARLQLEAGGDYNSQPVTLVVTKGEASIKWEDEKIDFGYLKPGFSEKEAADKCMYVSGLNDGNTRLRIIDVTVPAESPFRVEMGSGYYDMYSGESFAFSIMPESYSEAAYKKGSYDAVVTAYAQEIDEKGELVEGGKTVKAELPLHLEITDETYSITVDMQGHGENYELAGLAKGTNIRDKLDEVYEEGEPAADDYKFFGFSGNPLSSYKSWDEFTQDEENDLNRPLVSNTTVYAGWLTEYTGAVNLTLEAPKCGTSAEDSAPIFTAPTGSRYTVKESSWSEGTDSWEPYTGVFVGGEEYIAAVDLQPEYLYCFPTEAPPQIFVNGEEIDTSFSRGGLINVMVRVPVKVEHSLIKTEAVEATCEEEGNIEYWTCEGCGKVFSDAEGKNEIQQADTVVEKTGHALTKTEEVPATCTTAGTEAYWTCASCEKMFSDAEGKNEINKPVEISATGHTEITIPAVEPTCTEAGKTEGKKCSVCGEVLVAQEEVPAKGHQYDEGVVTTEPTCTEEGVKTYTCSVCGDKKTEAVAAKGHTEVVVSAVEPTCTEPGKTEGKKCSVCGEILVAQKEVPATGHQYDEGVVTTEPTCTEEGVKTFTCSVCGDKKTEAVAAKGHQYDEGVVTTEPTCTEEGVKTYTCSVCGDKKTEAVAAKGHQYDEGVVTTEPTCTEEGVKTYTCSVCGDTKTEVVAAKGHQYDEGVVTTEPTCTEEGVKTYTCSVCGDTKTEAVAAKGHQYDEGVVTTEPTCTEEGVKTYTCSVCGDTKTEVVAAKGHQYDEGVVTTEPTCTEEGMKTYTCSVCNDKKTEAVAAKGHSWGSWTVTKAATTSAAGEEAHTCSVCGQKETRAIPKKQETKYSNGWHKIGGEWYYYKNNAKVTNGWAKDSKGWCFLDKTGKMVRNGWVKDSKGYCWLNSSGYWVTGTKWIKCNGDWYYITNGYRDANKWKKDSKGWCYLGKDGKMVTNGWAKDSKGWCWMGSNGYWTSNKWVKDKGEWYYIKSNHYMAANEWAKDSKGWMYMAGNGKITKSKWIKSGGAWYYLKDNGYMATGTLKIGSKTYRFASSGKWID